MTRKGISMKKRQLYYPVLLMPVMTWGCSSLDFSFAEETWRTHFVAGEEAYRHQQFDLAIEKLQRSLNEIEKDGRPILVPYYFLSMAYKMQGKHDRALEVNKRHVELIEVGNSIIEKPHLPQVRCLLADILLAQGRFDEALRDYEQALNETEDEAHKVATLYPYIGNYYVQVAEYETAKDYLQPHLARYKSTPTSPHDVARAMSRLAMPYYYAGDDETAEKLFGDAAGRNAGGFVAFEDDLAHSLTMLGRIQERRGTADKALQAYESALNILRRSEEQFDMMKTNQADVWVQLGQFQLKQGEPEEARAAYESALRLRRATQTHTHPSAADALKGLADIAAAGDELTSATLLAGQALEVLDTALVPTHPRISPTLVALASLHRMTGQPDRAAPLDARLETILQKPLGPPKEDFLETAAFYARLLKDAGHPAAAERLEQLHARHQDRR